MALANGGGSPDRAISCPTGLPASVQTRWLPAARFRSYAHHLSTAAKLSRSVGFQRKSGKWYLPNGKRLTITINSSVFFSPFSASNTVAHALQAMLAAFGIQARKVNGIGDLDLICRWPRSIHRSRTPRRAIPTGPVPPAPCGTWSGSVATTASSTSSSTASSGRLPAAGDGNRLARGRERGNAETRGGRACREGVPRPRRVGADLSGYRPAVR